MGLAYKTTGSSYPVLTTFSGGAWERVSESGQKLSIFFSAPENDTNTMGSSLHCLSHWLHLLHLLGLRIWLLHKWLILGLHNTHLGEREGEGGGGRRRGRRREREKEGEGEGGRRRGRGREKGEGEGEINLSYTRACWPPWVQSQESATVYHLGRREYWQLFLCTWSGRGFLGPLLPVGSWGSMIFTLIPSTPEENTSA